MSLPFLKISSSYGNQSRLIFWHLTIVFHYQVSDISKPWEYRVTAKVGACS